MTLRAAGLVVAAIARVMAPWTIRNVVVFHAFIPGVTTGGLVFWGETAPFGGRMVAAALGEADGEKADPALAQPGLRRSSIPGRRGARMLTPAAFRCRFIEFVPSCFMASADRC